MASIFKDNYGKGTREMIDIGLAMLIGFMVGLYIKPKDKDLAEQQAIYDKKAIQYEIDIAYYKQLCHWHVERRKADDQKETT
jgi:hypothetical protein